MQRRGGDNIRFAIAFILFSICAYIGYSCSNSKRKRLALLNGLIGDIRQLGTKMAYRPLPVQELFESLEGVLWKEAGKRINSSDSMAGAFGDAIGALIDKNGDLYGLDNADVAILMEFGASLGSSDLKAQRANIELTVKLLEERADALFEEVKRVERVYRSLGVLGGLALAIIVL